MTDTLRERVRERFSEVLWQVVHQACAHDVDRLPFGERHKVRAEIVTEAIDTLFREFHLQPVSSGKVDAETGEVGMGTKITGDQI